MGREVFLQAVLAVGAADAGFAPSSVKALHGLEVFAIHVGLAALEFVRSTHGCIERTRVDGGGTAVLAVVGESDGLVEGFEGGDGKNRAECLLLHDAGVLPAAAQNRGLVVIAD